MKRQTGSPRLYLASSVTKKALVANLEERLRSILATLEECRAALIDSGDRETALLVSVAILELRMKLNRITDAALKALCDAMLPDEAVRSFAHADELFPVRMVRHGSKVRELPEEHPVLVARRLALETVREDHRHPFSCGDGPDLRGHRERRAAVAAQS